MPWISRGLRDGIVTSHYPQRSDGYGSGFRAAVTVSSAPTTRDELDSAARSCPTGAIAVTTEGGSVDRARCILCGRCVQMLPRVFQFSSTIETSTNQRAQLVVPEPEDDDSLEATRLELASRVRALRRSVHLRHVDAGSDGSDEWEIAALTNPVYDVQRLGIYFTASPRHADILLVTGLGSAGMAEPLRRTFDAMPNPKVVIAAGVDAIGGGLIGQGYASNGGVGSLVPVDVFIPGAPASPFTLLHGILLAINLLPARIAQTGPLTGTAP